MKTVRALIIDPVERAVYGVDLLVTPPGAEHGPQISVKQLHELLRCESVDILYLPNGRDAYFIGGEGLYSGTRDFFQLGPGRHPIVGKCLIVGHDLRTDSFRDATVTGAEITRSVIWTRRVLRSARAIEIPGGICIEADLPIIDE